LPQFPEWSGSPRIGTILPSIPRRIAFAILSAVACITQVTHAENPGDGRGFGFERVRGYYYLGHNQFGRTVETRYPETEFREETGGLVTIPVHFGRVEARLGIGGEYILPSYRRNTQSGFAGTPTRVFYAGPAELSLRVPFQVPGGSASLQAGRFPVRTHPDAALYGEYLVRYGVYPSHVENPVPIWDSLGSLAANRTGIGFKTWFFDASLRSEILLVFNDPDWNYERDFSLAVFLDGSLRSGFSWGAGGQLYRMHPPESNLMTPSRSANPDYYDNTGPFVDTVPSSNPAISYYSFGNALMFSLRAGLDFRALLDGDGKDWRDGRLFAEAALLGWKNQPYYYEDRIDRIVYTLGMHLPTFGILDVFCAQWETHPHRRSTDWSQGSWYSIAPRNEAVAWWSAGVLLSKDLLGKWLTLQGRFLYEPREEGVYLGYGANYPPSPFGNAGRIDAHQQKYLVRLMSRF
jgi:hypothetical protein